MQIAMQVAAPSTVTQGRRPARRTCAAAGRALTAEIGLHMAVAAVQVMDALEGGDAVAPASTRRAANNVAPVSYRGYAGRVAPAPAAVRSVIEYLSKAVGATLCCQSQRAGPRSR